MKYIFGILILSITLCAHAQTGVKNEDCLKVKNQSFDSLMSNFSVDFSPTEGFSETNLIENENILYHKSYKHDSSGFEIRIWIRDIKTKKTPKGLTNDQFSKSFITMLSLNASGYVLPDMPQITVFDRNTAKSEFNADWVASTSFIPHENGFNSGFEVCSIIGMRKNELAEVYVFFMISDRAKEIYLVKELAQVVSFK
jgi:hypothetical protein